MLDEQVRQCLVRAPGKMQGVRTHGLCQDVHRKTTCLQSPPQRPRSAIQRDGDQWRIERDRYERTDGHAVIALLATGGDDRDAGDKPAAAITQIARIDPVDKGGFRHRHLSLLKPLIPSRHPSQPCGYNLTRRAGFGAGYAAASSCRTIAAPALSASSLPRATLRASGVMPQLVQG